MDVRVSWICIALFTVSILEVNCKIFEIWSSKAYQDKYNKILEMKNEPIQSNDVNNEVDYKNKLYSFPFNFWGKGASSYNPDVYLDTLQLIAKYGYEAESHVVKTDDGYLLSIHRIPCFKTSASKCQSVFLQHGLLASSADFVIPGPNKSLAFILADAGYDVWMGNFRGNTYSRAHVNKSTSDSSFWDFSWHEHAVYDLPAVIDYINNYKSTKNDILYIGHSMGTTTLFALLSAKPEYNSKLKAAFTLAPVAYSKSLKSPIRYISPFANSIEWIAENLGLYEFLPSNMLIKWLAKGCEINPLIKNEICENVLFILCGYDSKQLRDDLLPIIFGHSPAGASTKTIIHYAQEIRDSGNFQMFDYGSEINLEKYGQSTPPPYNVSNIDLPIAFFCAENDWLSAISDAQHLYSQLKNGTEFYKVPYKSFNHLDFLWGSDAPTLVFKELLNLMARFRH